MYVNSKPKLNIKLALYILYMVKQGITIYLVHD